MVLRGGRDTVTQYLFWGYGMDAPYYTIRCYGDYLYRVCKHLVSSSGVRVSSDDSSGHDTLHDGKFDSALSRAKGLVREYALCNRWDYFVTLTFDSRWDRYDLKARIKELMQYIQNLNKSGYSIRYLLVPEFHKDGAVHLHGLMSGIPVLPSPSWWPRTVNRKADGSRYDHCPLFSDRYGYSSVDVVSDPVAVGFYTAKYIIKSLAASSVYVGVHTYYHSRGLLRSLEVGSVFSSSSVLDSVCKFGNRFCKCGFARYEDIGSLVDICDDVSSNYSSYVLTDPVTDEVIAVMGGSSDDEEYVQEVFQAFSSGSLSGNLPWSAG